MDHRLSRRTLLAGSSAAIASTALASRAADARQDAPADARAILLAASTRLAATPTIRFTLKIEGKTYIDDAEAIQLIEAEGDLVRPDSVYASFKIKVLGTVTANISLITIGDQYWSTDLVTGKWLPAPPEFTYDPKKLFDDENGIGPVMDKVENAELVGEEKVDDRECWRVRAIVSQEVVGPLTSNTMKGEPITVDLWVDMETSDLMRAQLAEPEDNGKDDPATWVMDLRDHGDENITIEAPE